jgi:flagellar protein FlaG
MIMDIRTAGNIATNSRNFVENKDPVPVDVATIVASTKPDALPVEDTVQKVPPPPSAEQVRQALNDINKSMQSLSQGLEFSFDAESKQSIVKVIDQQTKEVIRQMPSQEAVDMAKALDQMIGKLIREKA